MKYHSQYIKLFYRFLSEKVSPIMVKYNISANAISISRIIFAILAGVLYLSEYYIFHILSAIFLFIFSFFDALDGSIAQKTKKSYFGLWIDPLFDRLGLLIIFSCISLKLYNLGENLMVLIPLLNFFFYIQRSLIGSDIRTKEKFIKFREFYSLPKNENTTETVNDLTKKSLSIKRLLKFVFHQFSPHTHNQIIYLMIFIIVNQMKMGITVLFTINLFWYLYEVYKVTKISIKLDNKNSDE